MPSRQQLAHRGRDAYFKAEVKQDEDWHGELVGRNSDLSEVPPDAQPVFRHKADDNERQEQRDIDEQRPRPPPEADAVHVKWNTYLLLVTITANRSQVYMVEY